MLSMLEETGTEQHDADGLAEFLAKAKGADVTLLLRELGPEETRVSVRTSDAVDATAITVPFRRWRPRAARRLHGPSPSTEAVALVLDASRAALDGPCGNGRGRPSAAAGSLALNAQLASAAVDAQPLHGTAVRWWHEALPWPCHGRAAVLASELGGLSLWRDEVASVVFAKGSLGDLLTIIGRDRDAVGLANMATYYLLLHFWLGWARPRPASGCCR